MIAITERPIDVESVLQSVGSEQTGGRVQFIGTVRREEDLTGLYYECYPEMAERVLMKIVEKSRRRWPVEMISVVHRTGFVGIGEPSVVIAVSSAHRDEAFAACRFIIEEIKRDLPMWKKETRDESRVA